MPRSVGEMEKGGDDFDVEDEYDRFRRRQRIHCIFEANVKHKIVTKVAQFSLLASGWLCAIMPVFSGRERNARFEDGGIGGPDRGDGGRDDRPSHGAPPPPPPDLPPLLPEALRTTHGGLLQH